MKTMIHAVTVNHNTSHFAELMLRSLFVQNRLQDGDFRITVLDNCSNDEGFRSLQAFLAERAISFVQTGFDTAVAVEKHGLAFANFVENTPDASYYLFLDVDMWFIESDTICTMLKELKERRDCFANQARIFGYYADRVIEGRNGEFGRGDAESISFSTKVVEGQGDNSRIRAYATRVSSRCSPVCCLVENSDLFRGVVSEVGLTPATIFKNQEAVHYDTFGLMTHVMATHGVRVNVSAKTVSHFTETTYHPEFRGGKDRDCHRMLEELRAGRSMNTDLFRRSDWREKQS
jgi:hypothetical protein